MSSELKAINLVDDRVGRRLRLDFEDGGQWIVEYNRSKGIVTTQLTGTKREHEYTAFAVGALFDGWLRTGKFR